MNNKKKLIIGIVLGIILVSGITYAILTWTSTRINLGITSDCFTIDYTKGGDITGSLKLLNEEDLITSDNKFTIKNGVGISSANIGINSNCNIEGYGRLLLNVTSISDAFTTGDSVGSLKYVVLKNTSSITNPREVTVTSLLNQSFDIEAKGSITSSGTKDILVRNLSNTEIYKYLIVIYIDNNIAGNDVIGATFTGNISADATQGKLNADYTLQKLNSLNSTITVDTSHTPDFTTVSGNNGVKVDDDTGDTLATGVGDSTNGIYASEDDFGTSYYFRGAVENNYVVLKSPSSSNTGSEQLSSSVNNKEVTARFLATIGGNPIPTYVYGKDLYFRIIRINGDGTIRMIYAGTSPHENGYYDYGTYDTRIGTSGYNSSYNDNAYVGYMYGTAGSSTYDVTHSNTNDSTIKTLVDDWYQSILSGYSYAIADTIYCNDRSVTPVDSFDGMAFTGTGIGTEDTAYSNLKRNWIDHTPSLKCTNKNDRFTVSNDIGNTALTYPVGLITLDEAAIAGGLTYDYNTSSYIENMDYYLYTGYWYWTMTPDAFAGGVPYVDFVRNDGSLGNRYVDSYGGTRGARPVVSLNSDAISGGSGTMTDPFVVG